MLLLPAEVVTIEEKDKYLYRPTSSHVPVTTQFIQMSCVKTHHSQHKREREREREGGGERERERETETETETETDRQLSLIHI